jgi:hypothetical protein
MRIAAVAATLVALAVGAPAAGADTTWTKVSTDYDANIVVPSLGLVGSTVVVAWTLETSPLTQDIDTVSFTTSPTQDVIGPATSKAAEAWASLGYVHSFFTPPGGGLGLAYGGIHSTNSTDPLIGVVTTLRNPDGSWAAPFVVSGSSGDPWTATVAGGIPWIATSGTVGIELFNGAVAHAAGAFDQNLQPQIGNCCGYEPRFGVDAAGHLWIAWYSNATGASGYYVQQLDPATGAPAAAPVQAPNSESSNNNSFGAALSCAATCRLVYGNSPAGGSTDTIVSWWPGDTPVTIANLAGTSQGAGRVLTSAYRADGRLWVAWWDGTTYRATLGDARGAGGEAQDIGMPKGAPSGAYALRGMAVGDNLVLATNYSYKPPSSGDKNLFAVFVNTIAPPAPVTKAPGPRDVTLQTSPSGKGFRIQVQYTLPQACGATTPCTLRGELRTRAGRRLYAATPLPGDTKLVLGTRAKFAVPKGAKRKIRFFITVSKSQLLKAPFSTEGASRVAETRLRVWYTAKGSKEALSVRDGRIKVSIARIRSGALPGLSGIL